MLRRCFLGSAMPLLAIVLCIATYGSQAAADDISWQRDLRAAARKSADQHKPLLVEITADWCGYCRKMQQTTFRDQTIVKRINDCFVPVTIDADANKEVFGQFGVQGLPTTVILSPEMKVVKRIVGYQTAEQLGVELAQFCPVTKPADRAIIQIESSMEATSRHAFGGYCLVTLLEGKKYVTGSAEFTSSYRRQTVCFASADAKRSFDADPNRYWPAGDGLCPVSIGDQRVRRPGNPQIALIYSGRLWFFVDQARQQRFRDIPGRYASQAPAATAKFSKGEGSAGP